MQEHKQHRSTGRPTRKQRALEVQGAGGARAGAEERGGGGHPGGQLQVLFLQRGAQQEGEGAQGSSDLFLQRADGARGSTLRSFKREQAASAPLRSPSHNSPAATLKTRRVPVVLKSAAPVPFTELPARDTSRLNGASRTASSNRRCCSLAGPAGWLPPPPPAVPSSAAVVPPCLRGRSSDLSSHRGTSQRREAASVSFRRSTASLRGSATSLSDCGRQREVAVAGRRLGKGRGAKAASAGTAPCCTGTTNRPHLHIRAQLWLHCCAELQVGRRGAACTARGGAGGQDAGGCAHGTMAAA